MKRIVVIGVGPGVGKSTFANRLGKLTNIEVTHLDHLYWNPNWVEAPAEEFRAAQQHAVQKEEWIVEGNYTQTLDIREPFVDTVIYLELPLRVCLYRVLKRRIQYHGKTREDMGIDCREKMDWAFLKFIVQTYRVRKKNMIERIESYAAEGKTVHYLHTSAQIDGFLSSYKKY